MYDLHCHVLPGIDDGARSLEEAIAMVAMSVDDGVKGLVVTPHVHPGRWDNTLTIIKDNLRQLREGLDQVGLSMEILCAGEVRLTDDILTMVAGSEMPYYGEVDGYRILLLEFPHGHIIPGSENLVDWLLSQHIRPMIAHPERNKAVNRDPEAILPFVEKGCWLQLTANSVTGDFGAPAARTSSWLLDRDLATVVASDAHNTRYRTPRLSGAYETVVKQYGATRADALFIARPAKLFEAAKVLSL